MERLYKLFLAVDATQVEINPFGETPDKQGTHSLTHIHIQQQHQQRVQATRFPSWLTLHGCGRLPFSRSLTHALSLCVSLWGDGRSGLL
jgi:hypothetical protein